MISRRKRFPTLQEFREWTYANEVGTAEIYEYFSNTNRVEMPEVGKLYEFSLDGENWHKNKLWFFVTPNIATPDDGTGYLHIRPITTPTRDEVLAKCKALGLTDAELEVLK
jgi:hypothetical protein